MGNSTLSKAESRMVRSVTRVALLQAENADRQRKADTRRRILLGAACMEMMKKDRVLRDRVKAFLKDFLTKPRDRAVFALDDEASFFEGLQTDAEVVSGITANDRAAPLAASRTRRPTPQSVTSESATVDGGP